MTKLSPTPPKDKRSGEYKYPSRRTGPNLGTNHEPLTPAEIARWRRLEEDPRLAAQRDLIHVGQIVSGLGLCRWCFGFVDDPRHSRIEITYGVGFRSRER